MEENVIYFLKILEIGLIASIKFLFAPFEAERYGFNFRDSFFITTSGGIIGILAFTFIGDAIAYFWRKVKNIFRKKEAKDKPAKKFKWSTRFIIKTKMRFGLVGVALITPSIISIPVGTFLLHRFYKKKGRNILVLVLSVLIWGVTLNLLAQYLKFSQFLHLPE